MRTTCRKYYRITCWIAALAMFFTIFGFNVGVSAADPDVPSTWAQAEIDEARAKGRVNAEADRNYKSYIGRRLFCALVVNLVETVLGQPVAVTITNPFEDTNEIDVIKAYQLGIVKGVSATRFAPDEFITREQIAVMMMRGARKLDELKGSTYASAPDAAALTFADQSDISYWALEDVQIANSLGIMKGVGENRINPKGNTTIEQSILLINRLYDGFTGFMESAGTSTGDTGTSVNQSPEAISNPAVFSVPEQTPLTIAASQLALDPDGDGLEIVEVTGSCAFGTAELTSDGKCRYVSNDIALNNTDEFFVVVSDGQESVRVTVNVNVIASSPANNPPVAISNPVVFSVPEQTSLAIPASQLATDPDGDEISIIRINGRTADYNTLHGTVSLTADGRCVFTSNNIAANVTDDFVVTVSDGVNEAHVNVRVNVAAALDLNLKPSITSVSLNGTAAVGETISAGMIRYAGGIPIPAPELAYQWMRASSLNGTYSDIPGATRATYVITQNDVGKYIKLKVTASGSATGSATSGAKGSVSLFSGGDGTIYSPYQIANKKQFMLLDAIGINTSGKYYELASDIVLEQNRYISSVFFGKLNGNGHTVTLDIEMSEELQGVGLFAKIGTNAEIRNLNVTGRISAPAADYAGGIVGINGYATISACSSSVAVNAHTYAGGIVGANSGTIEKCGIASGHVTGGAMTGGLAGINYRDGVIQNCYARTNVFANGNEGGLLGWNEGTVAYCYSAGKVDGYNNIGGLVGHNDGGTVSDSYYDKDVSGQKDTGRGTPKTTSQMQTKSTYADWDFTSVWSIDPGQYPELRLD